MSEKIWSDEADSIIKDAWQDGYSASQISEKLAQFRIYKSRNAVIGRITRLRDGGDPQLQTRRPSRSRSRKRRIKKIEFKKAQEPKPKSPPVDLLPRDVLFKDSRIPEKSIKFKELDYGKCRHPYGHGPFTYCGKPTDGGSYCKEHKAQNTLTVKGYRMKMLEARK